MKILPLLVCLSCLVGCQTNVRLGEPLTGELAGNDFESRMDFWHTLTQRPITSNDEAFHALLLTFDQEVTQEGYDSRVAALKERGWIKASFDENADRAIDRGMLSVILCRALAIKGGIVMRVVGPTPRYATRELRYMRLIPPGSSSHQPIPGNEFVSVIGKIEDYRRNIDAQQKQAALPQ